MLSAEPVRKRYSLNGLKSIEKISFLCPTTENTGESVFCLRSQLKVKKVIMGLQSDSHVFAYRAEEIRVEVMPFNVLVVRKDIRYIDSACMEFPGICSS